MKINKPVLIGILLLLPIVFLLNLGLVAFIDDEGNRALVALEMWWSGNYVTPTHHGAFYYNKPPLWNWILTISFYLHGGASEWATRLPAVLSLLTFGALIYRTLRQELGHARALLTALFFLTCGRVLLWESLLGLIDIFFSLIVYLLFWVVYHYERKTAWWPLFLASYGLMAMGYMLKGLPAIAFQGITLIVWLSYRGHWRQLFRLPHLASGMLSVVLVGTYYLIYHQYNDLGIALATILEESGKRTAAANSLRETLEHVFVFPFELFYHFLPWSILGLVFLKRDAWIRVWAHPFTRYAIIIGLANVIIYWLSPNFYPRYILMLIPLVFGVILQAIPEQLPRWMYRSFRGMGYLIFSLVIAAGVVAFFLDDTQFIPYLSLKVALLAALALGAGWYYHRHPEAYLFIMVIGMLLFRLGFDIFTLPARAEHASLQNRKTSLQAFAERWEDRDLAVFYNTSMEMASSFYLEQTYQRVIPRHSFDSLTLKDYYIFNPAEYDTSLFLSPVDSFIARHNSYGYFYVGQLRSLDSLTIEAARKGALMGY